LIQALANHSLGAILCKATAARYHSNEATRVSAAAVLVSMKNISANTL
jgi:hypothetical protein